MLEIVQKRGENKQSPISAFCNLRLLNFAQGYFTKLNCEMCSIIWCLECRSESSRKNQHFQLLCFSLRPTAYMQVTLHICRCIGYICLTFVIKLFSREEAKSHWLHLFNFPTVCFQTSPQIV